MAQSKSISAADALKAFARKEVQVTSFAVDKDGKLVVKKVKGPDGIERAVRQVETKALSEAHILAARDYGDRIAITTVDGRRLEASKSEASKSAAA